METKKRGRGQPSRKDEIPREALRRLYSCGCTDEEVAGTIGVTARTLDNWKAKEPEFFRTIKDWKDRADAEVERSLYERACGYSHPEDKVFLHNGEPVIVPTRKYYPPDATSMIFWLKNRQPEKWRDKSDVDLRQTGNMGDLEAYMKMMHVARKLEKKEEDDSSETDV